MRRTSFAIALSTAAATLAADATTAGAQESARARRWLIPHVGASAAVDARNGESRWTDMYLGFATLAWDTPVPRLQVRLDGVYARRSEEIRLYGDPCGPLCSTPDVATVPIYWSKVKAAGAFVGAAYDIGRGRQGPLRPYVVGGIGGVRGHYESLAGTTQRCTSEVCAAQNTVSTLVRRNERPLSGAVNVGAGTAYTWRWIAVVAEARYVAVHNGTTRGLNGALPVSLGVRLF
jgi:hypothetical protein